MTGRERQLKEAMSVIPRSIRPAGKVERGDPVAVIVEEAERGSTSWCWAHAATGRYGAR